MRIEQEGDTFKVSNDDRIYHDATPRRVWFNDVEQPGWSVADEFRRVVVLQDGTVRNGSVLIERMSADKVQEPAESAPAPVHSGFSGVFEPAATPTQTVAPTPAPTTAPHPAKAGHGKIHKRHR